MLKFYKLLAINLHFPQLLMPAYLTTGLCGTPDYSSGFLTCCNGSVDVYYSSYDCSRLRRNPE